MDLCQRGEYTDDLFADIQPDASERVMGVLDAINAKWGAQHPPARPRNHRAGLGHATGDDEPNFHDQAGRVVGGAMQLGERLVRSEGATPA